MIDGTDICMPALWCSESTLIAYSKNGYKNRSWTLPDNWKDVKEVTISELTFDGEEKISNISITDSQLSLDLDKNESIKIIPRI